jgi:ABC-type Fe3+/spermidine/putrescine transport system ATPase subunit
MVKSRTVEKQLQDSPGPGTAGRNAIEARDLCKAFGSFRAVDGISFDVPEGSFTTLLGQSGSGKSTTLRLLAGLESADSGTISLRSQVVNSPSVFVPPEKRRLGLVFQSYALWPHLSSFDQVAYPLKVRRDTKNLRSRVDQALELVGLGGLGHRYPAELSGGQQQRVALARAIVYEPSVLLLDEPLSNLDAKLRDHMRYEIKQLHNRLKISTVYVTHDQMEALYLYDQVIVMHQGKIVERGTPREIYESPKRLESARFVGASNVFPGSVHGTPGESGVEIKLDGGLSVHAPARSGEQLESGQRVAVGIKPEDVRLGAPLPNPALSLEAEVELVSYFGSHVDVSVRTAELAWRVRAGKEFSLRPSDSIELTVARGAVSVFPLDEAGQDA